MESSEKKLRILSDRILEINEMTDIRRKVQECYKLFVDVLKNEDLYIIGLPNTTKDSTYPIWINRIFSQNLYHYLLYSYCYAFYISYDYAKLLHKFHL